MSAKPNAENAGPIDMLDLFYFGLAFFPGLATKFGFLHGATPIQLTPLAGRLGG
jgi:hypothetical protein